MLSNTIRILHVDDEPDFGETAAAFLEREDDRFEVETANGAAEGLRCLDEREVDCIVSDYDMPGRDGIEFLGAVREEHPDVPFILFTGNGSEEVASEAISRGVSEYLQKASGTEQYELLANRISNIVEGTRSAIKAERRRHRLEQILKMVPSCVVQLDIDGDFIFANQRAEEVLGLEADALIDRKYNDPEWEIQNLDGGPMPDEELPFRRVRDTGEPLYGVRHTIRWPDGTRKVLLVNGAPLFDRDGAVESAVFSITDITDQQDQERELTRAQRRLELALEATDMGVWEWELETDEVAWSETLERAMGLEPGGFEGTFEAFTEYVHPDDRPHVREEVEHAIETGSVYKTEFRMCPKNGPCQWIELRGQLLEDAASERLVGIHHDITERKKREQELEQQREQFQYVEDVANIGYWELDLETPGDPELSGSRGVFDIYELPDTESLDVTEATEFYHPEDRPRIERAVGGVIADREPYDLELRLTTAAGNDRWVHTVGEPVTREGDVVKIRGIMQDVTEYKHQEQALADQNERLGRFASIVSHDLRNPLRVADGRLELLREECESQHLDPIGVALGRIDRIIEDLLVLAREGRDIGDTEPVDIHEMFMEAWSIAADGHDGAAPVVRMIESEEAGKIEADGDRLRQLLENLIRNAVEHGGDGVTVTVGGLNDGFYVEDDGPGIPVEEREHVFEASYSTNEDGTGFGLSIVEQIVEAHGWNIRVTDGSEGGARFEITAVEFTN
jgi:PAS domain S-box-containing protein